MSMLDESYPPFVLMLPGSHDLAVVATVDGSNVSVAFDAAGRAATVAFGDGTSVGATEGPVTHTYAAPGEYTVTVTSGRASGTATALVEAPPEPEPEGFGAPIPVDVDEEG